MQRSQNQQIQAALEEQRKQNMEHLSKMEASLNELKLKEFELEKEKIVNKCLFLCLTSKERENFFFLF